MSTLQNNQPAWPLKSPSHVNTSNTSKYEKCLIITEEIYKRINITFEIKKLESGSLSDSNTESIDSNDLSNETDLFAYDKSSSISSSVTDITEPTNKLINININNNELKKTVPFVRASRPKKRFRKRAKKRLAKSNVSDTDCSSDEQLPLSRIAVDNAKSDDDAPDKVGNVEYESKVEVKEKVVKKEDTIVSMIKETTKEQTIEEPQPEKQESKPTQETPHPVAVDLTMRIPLVKMEPLDFTIKKKYVTEQQSDGVLPKNYVVEPRSDLVERNLSESMYGLVKIDEKTGLNGGNVCHLCQASFRGARGLKRHMTMSHITVEGVIPNN